MYRLLIADDEMIEREAIKYIIKENLDGMFDICEACNGREAIEKASDFKPDIIFFDIKMPGINGIEAASKVHELLPECRIILMSAYQYFNYAKDALSAGADDYIVKPAPIEKIVSVLQKAVSKINDHRIKKKNEEETTSKLKQITHYLEEELLVLIASGEIDGEDIKYYLNILNISCKSYLGAVISVNDSLYDRIIIINTVIEKLRDKLKSKEYNFLIRHIGQQIFLLLMINHEMDDYKIEPLFLKPLAEISEGVSRELGIKLNMGLGCPCSHISQIYNSFIQARAALKHPLAQHDIIYYGSILNDKAVLDYPADKEKMLFRSFLQGDEKQTVRLLDELIDWMEINLSGTEHIKQRVYELLLLLKRELCSAANHHVVEIDTEKIKANIFLLDSVREIRIYIKGYIISNIQELNSLKTPKVNSLLSIVMDFIEKNYSTDISLEDAAELVKINPYYLSKLFKQETGKNFIDYLTSIRVRKAKELLSNPTNNVKDICYKVGYNDPNYFTRVFKKICGLTPTEYKYKNVL